ncbi:MAG: bifunctional histidinol-phosphatase/imidazoleglycerol-phosphate dehydratase HisB [Gammaproteobacteria bacterium]
MAKKILFIDRDGTLIAEPEDKQIDSLEKLVFLPGVFSVLLQLKNAGYSLVMVSNQDGLGTESFPQTTFEQPHQLMLNIFRSQGIEFDDILICPHKSVDQCECRKPKLGLVQNYLVEQKIERNHSYVIGDRETDLQLAANMGIKGIRIAETGAKDWYEILSLILNKPRVATIVRNTNETKISITVNLDDPRVVNIQTGVGFFDHMLEQLAKHGGFGLQISVVGDLHIDDHHTVEDVGIALGQAMRQALGDKRGIARYGFLLPMDEALAQVALDLSGRFYFTFSGNFTREKVGDLSTELVPHFFRSLAENLKATLHIEVKGENTHHMVEGIFKAVGRALRQAFTKVDENLPSTKGVL